MSDISSRKDYEHNMNVLRELMNAGKVTFSYQVKKSVKGLLNVRSAPNGRIDLLTIDELARTTAKAMVMMKGNQKDFLNNDKD